ncbi:uncharacterized protein LOC143723635 isoform X3 [Siphateles boraxobius]|uniref:uncharacterized protein LOC143723635 isoform X3 n=1 Tax=Siphateles boraxobius TaxID=180520 RepID=UPI004063CA16
MDVNLTISLMRGQMGAVIEKAVNVAVETVLGEMIRVVGLKFEEIKREMTAKEKENENIRRMLETSRCQMKTMRKYISVLAAKDANHRLYQGDGDMALSTGMHCRRVPTSTVSVCAKAPNPCPRPRVTEPAPVAGPSWVRHHMHMSKETLRNENNIADFHIEEIHGSSVNKVDNSSPHLVDSQGLLSETSDPIWGQTPLASAETGHTDMPDSSVLSAPMMADPSLLSQTTSTSTVTFGAPSLKIKQEEAEVEIVCVKDEPAETGSMSRLEYSNPELHHHVGEPELGLSLDLPASYQALQSPGTSADLAIPAFINMDPTTYSVMAKTAAEKQRAYRARRDADPDRRERYLRTERERWRRDVETGKKKRIGDLCEKAQRWRRKQWREAKERQKRKPFFKIIASPPDSPEPSLMVLLQPRRGPQTD